VITIVTPADGADTSERPEFSGAAGQAEGDEAAISLTVPAGTQSPEVRADGTWSIAVSVPSEFDEETNAYTQFTATAEQRDEAGNVGRATVSFTPQPVVD
jgi:hypothetical protein